MLHMNYSSREREKRTEHQYSHQEFSKRRSTMQRLKYSTGYVWIMHTKDCYYGH